MIHRDLRPGNVLVSNKHYARAEVENDQLEDLFNVEPVVCKLTVFGESRSQLLQTSLIHAQTSNIERGTKPCMAPEIILESRKLSTASLEDMKAIDVWALGMTLFGILNPDTSFPFEIELKSKVKVSQSTPIEEADEQLAEALEQSISDAATELPGIAPANDGTNTCTFLCLVAAQKLFNAMQKEEMNGNWPEVVPGIFQEMILQDLVTFNTFREKRHYDALECIAVLKKEGVLPDSTELV